MRQTEIEVDSIESFIEALSTDSDPVHAYI